MKRIASILPVIALVLVLAGCQKQLDSPQGIQGDQLTELNQIENGIVTCGTTQVRNILDQFDLSLISGTVELSNDATNLYVKVTSVPGRLLRNLTINYGTYDEMVVDLYTPIYYSPCNGPLVADYRRSYPLETNTTTVMVTIPLTELPEDCFYISVQVGTSYPDGTSHICGFMSFDFNDPDDGQAFGSGIHQGAARYCVQECEDDECGQLRTQTPGGWGADPAGNNPGTYLHENFDAAFGDYLAVGCYPGDFYVKLTSAQAITNLLPTGGAAAALTMNYTDPASIKNVLVGHIVALSLAVGFDNYDADFGFATEELEDMIISTGTFEGWTVGAFLDEANKVLGGCSTAYTIEDVLTTATYINENYTDGTIDNGYLECPEE